MDGDVFSAAVLEKLPLADSVWRLLHFTMDDSWLEDLWARQCGRCYERDLKFSTLAHLIAEPCWNTAAAVTRPSNGGRKRRFCRFRSPRPTTSWGICPGGQRDPARGRHPEDERGPARDPGR